MPSRDEYQRTLTRLETMLRRKPMTAREIAERLGCCRPVAYQRVQALQKQGVQVQELDDGRAKKTPGPRAVRFRVTGPATL